MSHRFKFDVFIWMNALLLICASCNLACTAFCLKTAEGLWIGKNLDWPIGDGLLVTNPSGVNKTAVIPTDDTPMQWVSQYASLTFNQFGKELPVGGMNEAGLVIEGLAYSPSRYPDRDDRMAVNEFQWIQYQLDCCSTVQQVIDSDSLLRPVRLFIHLHFFIADQQGQAAVIEYLNGQTIVHHADGLPYPALTNNTYKNSLKYLHQHEGYGGDMTVHSGPESPDRFVRTVIGLHRAEISNEATSSSTAFDILASVRQSDTQWSIVYNPLTLDIDLTTLTQQRPVRIDVKPLLVEFPAPTRILDIHQAAELAAVELPFVVYTKEANRELLASVLSQLEQLKELEREKAKALVELLTAAAETGEYLLDAQVEIGVSEQKSKD
ncbi:linear amide C-N hydrolase [candidate division KSB1 bacterium]|nr:linear amide C-N hydrolase [candidate division KSB1 bacterium]